MNLCASRRTTLSIATFLATLALLAPPAAWAQSGGGLHLEKSEAWAPQALAAPKVAPQADDAVVIEGNGTRTCTGGWQYVYSGVRGGHSYRIRAQTGHRDISSPRDSLQAVALWGRWDPAQNKTRNVPYNHLLPRAVSPDRADFECVVTAPADATELTIRYISRWTATGTSKWSAPQIDPVATPVRKPVKICVVSSATRSSAPSGNEPISRGACAPDPEIALGLPQDVEQSVRHWAKLVLDACQREPQLIVLPETVIGGRHPLEGAITVPGPATAPFEKIARDHHVHLLLGVNERSGDARYNSAVLISSEGKLAGVYRKVHLATAEGWSGVSPGGGFPVFDTAIGRIGSMICMDSMLPESARMLALGGAEIICLPIMGDLRADRLTPGPPIFHEDRWKAIMRTRALDNQITLVVARNGGQGSCIIDRRGDIIAWNEGDRSIIEATIPAEDIRYWAGGDLAEVTYLLRRPALYDRYTDEAGLGPLPSPSALPTTNRP